MLKPPKLLNPPKRDFEPERKTKIKEKGIKNPIYYPVKY